MKVYDSLANASIEDILEYYESDIREILSGSYLLKEDKNWYEQLLKRVIELKNTTISI